LSTPTQLSLYNGALRLCKQTPLVTTTDDIEAATLLNTVWSDGAVDYCLEQKQWKFPQRTSRLDADPNFVASFGYAYRFEKPTDWIRTTSVCSDEYFDTPLTSVQDEAGSWFSNITPIYVSYISNGVNYGGNWGLWPETFTKFVEAYLAREIVRHLTSDKDIVKDVLDTYKKAMDKAASLAAMNESASFLPIGAWIRSRRGNQTSWDRGNQNQLIG
jgi:hypothetical protein